MSLDRFDYRPPSILDRIRRRRWLTQSAVVVGLILVLIAAWVGYYCYQCRKRINVSQVEQMLAESGPPPGSSKDAVVDWINAHRLGGMSDGDRPKGADPAMKVAEDSGIPPGEVHDTVIAVFFDAYVDPVFLGDILVYFLFDKHHRLIKPVVKRWVDRW